MKPHEAAFMPGEPPVLWSPRLAQDDPWLPGLAVWHRSQKVWYSLSPSRSLWATVPYHATLLVPQPMPDGAANLATRVDQLEQALHNGARP